MAKFETFRVLLDDPAETPALGYDDYARAFSDVIRHSEPHFAIGIFGDWGSGKTTLMRAIERKLARHKDVVCVWFNAWRYEREPDLIVPMLDTLREELARWAKRGRRTMDERDRARRAVQAIRSAARALVRASTVKAGLPGASVEIAGAGLLRDDSEATDPATPLSFYHSSFRAMSEAVQDFFELGDDDQPIRRVVVFIDDLDRCLPESALQVLESMKLFFDLKGFVFVVGLDREVIERSIETKYRDLRSRGNGESPSPATPAEPDSQRAQMISGADYVKKIFQVPFGLPRISASDVRPFFTTLADHPDLPAEQRADLWGVVWPHIDASTRGTSVNPREMKRLINAYTLQMKMLTVKLKGRRAAPNPNVVLALQVFAFRADWAPFYEALTADPELFAQALEQVVRDRSGRTEFALTTEPLPRSLLEYVRETKARALSTTKDLDVYVTTAEATRSSDPAVLEIQGQLAEARRALDALGRPRSGVTEADVVAALHETLRIVASKIEKKTSPLASEALAQVRALEGHLSGQVPSPSPEVPKEPPDWSDRAKRLLGSLEETIRAMRRDTVVGSAST